MFLTMNETLKNSNRIVGETTAKNSMTADNVDLSKIVISGTAIPIPAPVVVGAVVIVGVTIYYCSNPKEAQLLAEAMEANIARQKEYYSGIAIKGVKATGDMIEDLKNQSKSQMAETANSIGEATMDATGISAAVLEASKKTTKQSGKAKASDTPSWSKGKKPKKDEDRNTFLDRIFDEQYGKGNWSKKSREYSQLKKAFDRGGL